MGGRWLEKMLTPIDPGIKTNMPINHPNRLIVILFKILFIIIKYFRVTQGVLSISNFVKLFQCDEVNYCFILHVEAGHNRSNMVLQ